MVILASAQGHVAHQTWPRANQHFRDKSNSRRHDRHLVLRRQSGTHRLPATNLPHRFPACAADAHAPLARTLVLRLRLRTVRRSQEVVTVVLQCSASTNGRSGSWLCENALRELDVWQAMECGLVLSGNEPHVGGELCPHCRDERLDAEDVHDAREIVGQYMQGHLGCHAR